MFDEEKYELHQEIRIPQAARIVASQCRCLDRDFNKSPQKRWWSNKQLPMISIPFSAESSPVALPPEGDVRVVGDIRTGSPFAAGSMISQSGTVRLRDPQTVAKEAIGEGVWRETAASAVFASGMLIGFAIPGWLWFPAGGILIALLGVTMSLLGFSSRYVKLSAAGLVIHGVILVGCYFKTL